MASRREAPACVARIELNRDRLPISEIAFPLRNRNRIFRFLAFASGMRRG